MQQPLSSPVSCHGSSFPHRHSLLTTFQGTYQDSYSYRADGQLMGVTTATQVGHGGYGDYIMPSEMGGAVTTGTYVRDAMGRTTSYTSPNYSATSTYDYLNALTSQTTDTVRSDGSYHAVTTYDYRAESYAGSGVWTGAYQGGSLVHSRTTTTKGGVSQPTTDTKTTLVWWDSAQASHVTFTPNIGSPGTTNNSSYYYDDTGHLQSVYIQDGRSRTVSFVNNAEGQILSRDESDSLGTGDPRQLHYYFNGQRIGDISNNGNSNVDYVAANAQRTGVPGTGPFAGGSATSVPYADFDQSYDPINGLDYAQAASRYSVNTGDTLSSIATQLWGDASLWYKLAEINGLTGAETLVAGMSLIVPAGVRSSSNSDSTFRPYDPSVAQGDLSPTAPSAPKKAKNCGVFGMILLIVIAIAVTAVTAGAAAAATTPGMTLLQGMSVAFGGTVTVGAGAAAVTVSATTFGLATFGAIGAVAGSIISQGIGVATGIQDKFSWKGVALAGISGAIGGASSLIKGINGISAVTGKATTGFGAVTSAIGRAVVGNVATQGIAVATRLQRGFDWTSVAMSAISGGVNKVVGGALHLDGGQSVSNTLKSGVSGAAGAIASAGARSIVEGTSFGDNVMATLPDVIGQTVGNLIINSIVGGGKKQTDNKDGSGGAHDKGAPPGTAAASSGSDAQDVSKRVNLRDIFIDGVGGYFNEDGTAFVLDSSPQTIEARKQKALGAASVVDAMSLDNRIARFGQPGRSSPDVSTGAKKIDSVPYGDKTYVPGGDYDSSAGIIGASPNWQVDEDIRVGVFLSGLAGKNVKEFGTGNLSAQTIADVLIHDNPIDGTRMYATAGVLSRYADQYPVLAEAVQIATRHTDSMSALATHEVDRPVGLFLCGVTTLAAGGAVTGLVAGYSAPFSAAELSTYFAGFGVTGVAGNAQIRTAAGGENTIETARDDFLFSGSLGVAGRVVAPLGEVLVGKIGGSNNWGTGRLRGSARPVLENEGILINESQGLQSRASGLFDDVAFGEHGDASTKYLYTVDERGINIALESTPFPTPRGNIVHTNLSSEASIGGEAWFGSNNSVTINAGSGRFGDGANITRSQWNSTAKLWESLGYKVNKIPYGHR